jgi:hypothetical protein
MDNENRVDLARIFKVTVTLEMCRVDNQVGCAGGAHTPISTDPKHRINFTQLSIGKQRIMNS